MEVVKRCPSGAPNFEVDGNAWVPDDDEPEVFAVPNGPYAVRGGIELDDPTTGQTPQMKSRYTLCRCGASKNKPFCDGTH